MRKLAGRRPRVKLSKDERMRRLRLGDLRKLFADRCRGMILPDDDAGREYLRELLLPISIGPHEAIRSTRCGVRLWGPTDRMCREIELRAPWMEDDEAQEVLDEINLMPPWQRKPKARTLGERLRVVYGERQRLGLWTIGPCDMTEKAMELLRKQKKRARMRALRQENGAKPQAESLSQTKPWLAEGISRRTWERRRVATSCQVNLTKASHELASASECIVSKEVSKVCIRLPTATPAWQPQSEAEWADIWAEEAAWALSWEPERAAA
jgi:hypothetical protein